MNKLDPLGSFITPITTIPNAASSVFTQSSRPGYSWGDGEISLSRIISYLQRDIKFQYTVFTLMAYSVGRGYNNSANTKIPAGRKCLDLINNFCNEWDLDSINQSMGIDGWASGNGFLNVVGAGDKLEGLYTIPLSSIKDVNLDIHGEVESYAQLGDSGFVTEAAADQIAHFKWLPINGGKFGEGIGQALCRKGVGYKTSSGTITRRPSYFEMAEVMTDVNVKMFYSGQSRYLITPDSDIPMSETAAQHVQKGFEKLDPLEHLTSPNKIKVQEIALASRAAWDPLLERFDKEFSVGTKSPLIELMSTLDFSYASSKTALSTAFPLMDSFSRAYSRFIEKNIYDPLITQEGKNPEVVNVEINWGPVEKITIEDIEMIQKILNEPNLTENHDPKDIIDMLIECGVPLESTEKMVGAQTDKQETVNELSSISSKEQLYDFIIKQKKKATIV